MWVFRDTHGERTVSEIVLTALSLQGEPAHIGTAGHSILLKHKNDMKG